MVSRKHRFHGRNSLRFVLTRGQTSRAGQFALKSIHNNRQQTYRVAVVVSKKVSKSAAVRNRIRRRVYEVVRQNAGRITGPYDLVFSVYGEEAARLPHTELQNMIVGLMQKSGAVPETGRDTIGDVSNSFVLGIHSTKQNTTRKGEAVTAKPGRRKGETLSGLTPPSNKEENKE